LTDNRLGGDQLFDSYSTAAFVDKNAGIGKTVNVTGMSITGTDAGNYTLTGTTTTASANITQRALTVSATGVDRVYDGTTAASVPLTDNRLSGDQLTDNYIGAAFLNKNAGIGKTVNVGGITVSGPDAGNYTANATTTTSANITPLALTVSAAGVNKVYDGT